jgi:hypothetical protein
MEWLRWFGELTPAQAERLSERAIEFMDSDEKSVVEIAIAILKHQACFREQALSRACCYALMDRGVFWPSSLYRDTGDEVAHQLISRIESTDEKPSLNHLLLALAWTRSAAAFRVFRQWNSQAPSWAPKLNIPIRDYLPYAGWCMDGGVRRDLVSTTCIRLVPCNVEGHRRVSCRTRINQLCPTCGGSLSWLFDFSDVGKDRFGAELTDAPMNVVCCLHCACFGPVYGSYCPDGTAQLHPANKPCKFAHTGDREAIVRRLDDMPCPPFACAEPFSLTDASTLGGIPMWLQDAEFPRCIECGQVMNFFAQHDNSPLREEGIYYAFFCAPCHTTAVSYQQT